MPRIEHVIKNGKVTVKARINKGYDENGKKIRNRYSLRLSLEKYPTEEEQDKAFNDYLVSIGENPIVIENSCIEKDGSKELKKTNEIFDKNMDINMSTRKIIEIPLEKLQMFEMNPSRPTDEFIERLASSIHEDGLNNPIRVVEWNGKYIISAGNKRFRSYQLLYKKYGDFYNKIECYVIDYQLEFNNENLDPIFALRLMRDNVNTYERTLNDKILEVELYHKIFPALKRKNIASGRENEWIAKEMGISDKSVKDYIKLIKVDDVKNKFINGCIDYFDTAIKMVDFYNTYGKDDYYIMLGTIKENYQSSNNFQLKGYMIEHYIYNKEYEERMRKNKEIQEKRDQKINNEEEKNNNEIAEENIIPIYSDLDMLPHFYCEGEELNDFVLSIVKDRIHLKFLMKNSLDSYEYYYYFEYYHNEIFFKIVGNYSKKEDFWYLNSDPKNVVFVLKQMFEEGSQINYLTFINNVYHMLPDKKRKCLIIENDCNFIKDLLNGVFENK